MKKIISILIILATIILTIFCTSFTSSATAFPSFSKKVPLKAYTISTGNNTTAYTSNLLSSKKGTIYAADEIYIFSVGKNSKGKYYAYCSYPVSSGRKEAYIPLSVVTPATSASAVNTAQATATTYRRASTASSLGSIAKNDKVYKLATSGNYTQIIYNVGSASSPTAWKMGWVKTSDYNKLVQKTTTKTTTKKVETATNSWQYPVNSSYVCGNDWNTKYSARPSRPYHLGIDIASNKKDTNIYAAASGTIKATGYNDANGYYIIIQHKINNKTVYSFYAHLKKGSIKISSGNVTKGTKIAVIGNTGSGSAGTHLHFAIVDTLWTGGGYYGYGTSTGSKVKYNGVTYYNPHYVIKNGKLPS